MRDGVGGRGGFILMAWQNERCDHNEVLWGGHHPVQKTAWPRMNWISGHRRPRQPVEITDPGNSLRYSSPRPWILAIVLSLMLWATFGWYFWGPCP